MPNRCIGKHTTWVAGNVSVIRYCSEVFISSVHFNESSLSAMISPCISGLGLLIRFCSHKTNSIKVCLEKKNALGIGKKQGIGEFSTKWTQQGIANLNTGNKHSVRWTFLVSYYSPVWNCRSKSAVNFIHDLWDYAIFFFSSGVHAFYEISQMF